MNISDFGLLIIILIILAGFLTILIGFRLLDSTDIDKRIKTFVLDEQVSTNSSSVADPQSQTFSETFLQRTLFNWLERLIGFMGRFTPANSVEEINRRLTIAGNPFNFHAQQYYGMRILFFGLGLGVFILVSQLNTSLNLLLMAYLALVVISSIPVFWLRFMMQRRQEMIRRGLPDALDMLSVCASAGLSFDQSLLRVGQMFKTPIGMEFARMVSEMEVGISRQQALRNMQARVDISELSSFVAVIVQSELLGMSIADVLHSQAEQMRVYRQYRAKEIAQQLPAKMMIPLALFIFPALLAVILGPMVPALIDILK